MPRAFDRVFFFKRICTGCRISTRNSRGALAQDENNLLALTQKEHFKKEKFTGITSVFFYKYINSHNGKK